MNKIWLSIILISLIYGLISDNASQMMTNLFKIPEDTLKALLKIGSMLVIYNGLFQIAQDASIIKKMSRVLRKPVNYIFKTNDEVLKELISSSIIANLLGLGPANMSIAMKIVERLSDKSVEKQYYNLTMYLVMNISSLCILPLSTLAFRQTFLAKFNIEFILLLFISSFITTIFGIILVKSGRFDE